MLSLQSVYSVDMDGSNMKIMKPLHHTISIINSVSSSMSTELWNLLIMYSRHDAGIYF